MRATLVHASRPALAAFCAIFLTAPSGPASAQFAPSLFGTGQSAPSAAAGSPGLSLSTPGAGVGAAQPAPVQSPLNVPSAPQAVQAPAASPAPSGGPVALYLAARFGPDMPIIPGGLTWRIYSDKPDASGAFRPLKEEKVAAPTLVLPAGGYVVHATFGQASVHKHITLRSETVREILTLPAGGIRIEGRVGDVRIPQGQITFDIFKGSQFEVGDKRPLTQGVMTGDVMVVPEGTYTIVSNYGDGNAVVRSDIRVRPGQLTDVTVTHRAAVITLKLLASSGGEALANTAWSVLTPGGDVIKESIGAFPRVILAEGDYKAIARNEGKVFERDFKVVTGVDTEIAVLAR
ncbi:MAG TPA: hypothetical protein VJL90_12115 [Pseudorhodoplanes sp.]|nr:hypothetical protein [Pseudorhodoplanes sp.]